MIFKYLLFFLGLHSWEYEIPSYLDFFIKKRKVSNTVKVIVKNNLNRISEYSPSPINNIYEEQDYKYSKPNYFNKLCIFLYFIWSLSIFMITCIQPLYLLFQVVNRTNIYINLNLLFLYLNFPVNYVWLKYYFSTNHFEQFIIKTNWKCNDFCNIIATLSIFLSILSILPYLFYSKNEYYWSYNTSFYWYTFVSIEILNRNLIFTSTGLFILTFINHLKKISKTISDIEKSKLVEFNKFSAISELIIIFINIRSEIEYSIYFYNNLVSFSSVLGIIASFLFYNHKSREEIINFYKIDYYILVGLVYYAFTQIICLGIIYLYSKKVYLIHKFINSKNFISKYLSRSKPNDTKTRTQIEKNILIIEEESATIMDWLIIDKLTKDNWIDFTILGISTKDGSLIKKVITFSTIFYTLLKFF